MLYINDIRPRRDTKGRQIRKVRRNISSRRERSFDIPNAGWVPIDWRTRETTASIGELIGSADELTYLLDPDMFALRSSVTGLLSKLSWKTFKKIIQSEIPNITPTIIANEDIPAFRVVTTTGYIADSSNIFHRGRVAGIAAEGILKDFSGTIVSEGEVENLSWSFSAGEIIYLNGTSLSATCPSTGFRIVIGGAVSPTKILVKIQESILL